MKKTVAIAFALSLMAIAPATAIRNYTVFFDSNKAQLTSEARAVIAEAADTYRYFKSDRENPATRVSVVGHTDGQEAAIDANSSLARRRAEAVKREFIRLGIPENEIEIEARDFDDPMVPTDPGIAEPQNRRAATYIF